MGTGEAIASSVNARNANKETRNQYNIVTDQNDQNKAMFDMKNYQNMVDRTEVQDILRRIQEDYTKQSNIDSAQSAVFGATEDTKLAKADARNKSYANMAASIASNASMLKDGYANNYQMYANRGTENLLGVSDKIAGVLMNKANMSSQAADNAFKTGANMLGTGVDKIVDNG